MSLIRVEGHCIRDYDYDFQIDCHVRNFLESFRQLETSILCYFVNFPYRFGLIIFKFF